MFIVEIILTLTLMLKLTLLLMVALNTREATASGLYYLVHSTLATALMFLVAGLIIGQRGKAEDRFVQARPVVQPALLGALFFLAALALIGMPPISGFIGKALMLKAALAGGQAGWIWPPKQGIGQQRQAATNVVSFCSGKSFKNKVLTNTTGSM